MQSHFPPRRILIKTDQNRLIFEREIPKSKTNTQKLFEYRYYVSKTKHNMTVSFTEAELLRQLLYSFEEII